MRTSSRVVGGTSRVIDPAVTHGEDFQNRQFQYSTAEIETSVFEGDESTSPPRRSALEQPVRCLVVHGEIHPLAEEAPEGAQPLTEQAGLFRTVGMAGE